MQICVLGYWPQFRYFGWVLSSGPAFWTEPYCIAATFMSAAPIAYLLTRLYFSKEKPKVEG